MNVETKTDSLIDFSNGLDELIKKIDTEYCMIGDGGFSNQQIVWGLTKKIHDYMGRVV